MHASLQLTLPTGSWVDGERRQDAELLPLTGADELFLADAGSSLAPAERVTALLARRIVRLAGLEHPGAEGVRQLTVGDREALLLHARRLTFGSQLQCVLTCPYADCDERMDLELDLDALLAAPYLDAGEWHEVSVAEQVIRFRLPRGADQEAAAQLAEDDLDAAVSLVVARCTDGAKLEREAERALAAAMNELDPQAETRLNLNCTGCERPFSTLLDAGDYLCREIRTSRDEIFRDVHTLAFHYGWSEDDVLALPSRRRRRYLEYVGDELSGARVA